MKLSLVVLTEGKQRGKVLNITLAQFLIGRDPQCHLRPASPMISKRHCALIQREGKAFIRDFDSTNGSTTTYTTFDNNVTLGTGSDHGILTTGQNYVALGHTLTILGRPSLSRGAAERRAAKLCLWRPEP